MNTRIIIFIFTQLVLFLCQLLFVLSRIHQLQTPGTMDAYNCNDERIDHYLHCFIISFPTGLCSSIICDLVQDRIKSNMKSLERFILLLISVWLACLLVKSLESFILLLICISSVTAQEKCHFKSGRRPLVALVTLVKLVTLGHW